MTVLGIIYLDNSATTKPCETAVRYVNSALNASFANPSSLYGAGAEVQTLIDQTRELAARYLSCDSGEVFFTSCGTESNNTAVFGAARSRKKRGNRIVSTAAEHPSVLNALKALENEGFEVILVGTDKSGNVDIEDFRKAVNDKTILVSCMLVNNETGAIFPVGQLRRIVNEKGAPALVHCDATQGFCKIPCSVKNLNVDLLTASGHKIHAPKGVGILYKSKNVHIPPLLYGGGQESGFRSGTQAVPAILGLKGALEEISLTVNYNYVKSLYDYTVEKLNATGITRINSPQNGLPYIINVSVPHYRSEILLHYLEYAGIYVSSGSACAKGQKSHVLEAMGLEKSLADSALRISFSHYNTREEIDILIEKINEIPQKLRRAE